MQIKLLLCLAFATVSGSLWSVAAESQYRSKWASKPDPITRQCHHAPGVSASNRGEVSDGTAELIHSHIGQDRVLILYSPTPTHRDFRASDQAIHRNWPQYAERDLTVYSVFLRIPPHVRSIETDGVSTTTGNLLSARSMARKLRLNFSEPGYVLIGKDGGIKATGSLPLNEQALFDLIDAMPMRQREMGR